MKPSLCFTGPMVGGKPGFPPTQGQLLARLFSDKGYPVTTVSSHPNRYIRLIDIAWTLWRGGRDVDVQMLQVFGGLSFVVEDVASALGKLKQQKVVMILRGGDLPNFATRFPKWFKRVLGRADLIVTPSAYLARELAEWQIEARVIPNVLELSLYPYRQRTQLRPRILWMRAFHPVYNPEMALRAFASVHRQFPDALLSMAGADMGLNRKLTQLAQDQNLSDRVSFPGFLNMDDKARAGDTHDIYINTPRIDNQPVSVLEMMAMGLPLVSTDVGGIRDLVTDGETGLLVPNDDADAMAEAVIRLLEDPILSSRVSSNGRRLAKRYSWEAVAPTWEKLLSELTSKTSSVA